MQNITLEAIERLLSENGRQPAVTIYVPMHTNLSPPQLAENQIRLKNAISRAIDDIVKQYGEDHALARQLSATLDTVYDDLSFWEAQSAGLLLCARPGMIEMFRLPVDTEEYTAVDSSFHLAPVLGILTEDQQFYVLTINQRHPKLFRGDMYELQLVEAKLPESLAEYLHLDELNQQAENQGSASGPSTRNGWFNGRGGQHRTQFEDRMKYFRAIDRAINAQDSQRLLPLVLAGTDSETVEFRSLSHYPKLLRGAINGGQPDRDMASLHHKAQGIIDRELVQPTHRAAIEEFQRLEGVNPGRTASDFTSVSAATDQGRVDKLLAIMGISSHDNIRNDLAPTTKITFPDGHAESRSLNRLAAKVWRMSGKVINLTPQEMPHGAFIIARLRY